MSDDPLLDQLDKMRWTSRLKASEQEAALDALDTIRAQAAEIERLREALRLIDDDNAPWRADDFTHWTPLPEPPAQEQEKADDQAE